ncbi:hypothetical protein OLL83_001304 [Shewanella algae]|uniref:hypothetical protein n=1 Tax=Shewanella algae TaxID=38313 RepID=UPI002232B616|nr:hypothetical protein [Shewanella algae]UZD59742.1 hypothetical protein OLL83_001304 [Shewanella algae]
MKNIIFACVFIFSVFGCSSNTNSTTNADHSFFKADECTISSSSSKLWGTIIEFNNCFIPNLEQSKAAALKYCKQGEVITALDDGEDNQYVCQSIPNFQNTDLAIGTYCYYLSVAPVLSDVLSTEEKKLGNSKFFFELVKNDMRFPTGATFEFHYQKQYIQWLYGSFNSQSKDNSIDKKEMLHWYKDNCLP